jgi:hypothetical protein
MNPGTETGSLVNHLYSRMTKGAPVPEVGMAATILSWSDRQAGTVVSIEKNIIGVQYDTAIRTDSNGMSEMQEYEYSRNPNGCISYFRQDKTGKFVGVYKNPETGRWIKGTSDGLILGTRRQYRDFSF